MTAFLDRRVLEEKVRFEAWGRRTSEHTAGDIPLFGEGRRTSGGGGEYEGRSGLDESEGGSDEEDGRCDAGDRGSSVL